MTTPSAPLDDRAAVTSSEHRGALSMVAVGAAVVVGVLAVSVLTRSSSDADLPGEPVATTVTELQVSELTTTILVADDDVSEAADVAGAIPGLAVGVDQTMAIVDRSGDSIIVDLNDGSTDYLANHTVLAITHSFAIAQPLDGAGAVTANGAIVVIDLETGVSSPFSGYGATYQIVPAATPDDVWVWGDSGGNFGLFYALVSLDGVGAGVVFSTPAPSELIERPGREPSFNVPAAGAFAAAPYEPDFLGPGALLASSNHGEVWFDCDDNAVCGVEYRSGESVVSLDVTLDLTSAPNGRLLLLRSGKLAVAHDVDSGDLVAVDLETGGATSIGSGDWRTLSEMVMFGDLIMASRHDETLIIDPVAMTANRIELPTSADPSFVVGPRSH